MTDGEGSDRTPADLPVIGAEDLPATDPERERGSEDDPTVAGVLLAAGLSNRFGDGNKLLADVDGEPMVVRAARALLGADLAVVAVVVGYDADRVVPVVRSLGGTRGTAGEGRLVVVGNPGYARGQASSVRAGVRAVCGADAAVFALGDMPRIRPASVDRLVAAHHAGAGDALAAAHDGERGNPVLFDARHFPALAGVEGDTGGRDILLSGGGSALVETGDPGVLRDVDTADDLERIR